MKKVPVKPTNHWYKQKTVDCVHTVFSDAIYTWQVLGWRRVPVRSQGRALKAVQWEGKHHPASRDRSAGQTGAGWPQRHLHSDGNHELGKASPSLETQSSSGELWGRVCVCPALSPRPLPSWGWAAGYFLGAASLAPPPSLPSPAAWTLHPQASFLHFPGPRIRGRGDQGARVFCLLAGAVI